MIDIIETIRNSVVTYILIVMLGLFCGAYFVSEWYDCTYTKHGLYVKEVFGFHACVEEGRH